jgi:Fe-S-cluster containining protein
MVADYKPSDRIVKEVAGIYNWLDSQVRRQPALAGQCKACGACCDFARFDHRLFVTTPEIIYLATNLGTSGLLKMNTSACPYQANRKCTIYRYRFAGCRVFCCNRDRDFQSRLSESTLRKLKSLCTRYKIPYRYADLATGLDPPMADTCQSAEESCPEGRAG